MKCCYLLLCLTMQALAQDISDDYAGKDEEHARLLGIDDQPLRRDNEAEIDLRLQSRRMFDWIKNLFGLSNSQQPPKTDNLTRTGIDEKISKTEESILGAINRIANSLEKISNSINLQLHMMVSDEKGDSDRDRIRNENKPDANNMDINETSFMDLIYRIASNIERINTNMELQIHLMLVNKDAKNNGRGKNHRRGAFEWLYNFIFGQKSTTPNVTQSNETLYTLLTKTYDPSTELDFFEAVDRVGITLEKINANLEMQSHLKLDCNCKEKRFKGKNRPYKRETHNINYMVENLELISHERNKREIDMNETNQLDNKLSDNLEPIPLLEPTNKLVTKPLEPSNKDVTTSPTEVTTEKNEIVKISRRQDGNEIKQKLLNYIYESYNEIINKIDPLSKIKAQYQNEDMYKIGYVMSNIDTLEVNLKNMKKEVDTNKHKYDDPKILGLLDTFMASNRIVTSLIESLKTLQKPVDVVS